METVIDPKGAISGSSGSAWRLLGQQSRALPGGLPWRGRPVDALQSHRVPACLASRLAGRAWRVSTVAMLTAAAPSAEQARCRLHRN